jgi:hypothetical protein
VGGNEILIGAAAEGDIVFKFKKVLDVPVETVLIKKNFFEFQSTLSADEW